MEFFYAFLSLALFGVVLLLIGGRMMFARWRTTDERPSILLAIVLSTCGVALMIPFGAIVRFLGSSP